MSNNSSTTPTALAGHSNSRKLRDSLFAVLLFCATMMAAIILGAMLWSIIDRGWGRFWADPTAFLTSYPSRRATKTGIKAALAGTGWLAAITLIVSFPMGVAAAAYLEEIAAPGKLRDFVESNVANLAGVPSVVYGILGLGLFVNGLNFGPSLLAGGLTLALMALPVVIVTTREALRTVPKSVREASLALGATRWQSLYKQVLPAAIPGAVTGTLLGLARAIGETAPLLVVGAAITTFSVPHGLSDSFSALPVVIFDWVGRPQPAFAEAAAAASLVLISMVLALSVVAMWLRTRFTIKWQ